MGIKTKLFHKDKPVLGLDISTTGLKVMAINPKKMAVFAYGSIDLDPQKVQDSMNKGGTYLSEGLKKLMSTKLVGKLPSNHAVVSVPTGRTFSRTMSLPVSAVKNLQEAIQLEAEQYIPVPSSELYIDYEIIDHNKETVNVLLAAVPKRIVDNILLTCHDAGLEPVMIEPGVNAAARLITATEEGHLPSIIIDVGAASTDIALLDKVVRVTGGTAVGGHTFTLQISEKMKISLEEAHLLKVRSGLGIGPQQAKIKAALDGSLQQIAQETRKIIRYYLERIGSKTKIEQIIIVGGGSNLPGLGEYMTEALLMPARVGNPWQSVHFGKLPQPTRQFKPRFITAAGLAMVNAKEIWQ